MTLTCRVVLTLMTLASVTVACVGMAITLTWLTETQVVMATSCIGPPVATGTRLEGNTNNTVDEGLCS